MLFGNMENAACEEIYTDFHFFQLIRKKRKKILYPLW